MTENPPPTPPQRSLRWIVPLVIVLLLVAASGWGWHAFQQWQEKTRLQSQADAVRLQGLLDSVDALRRDQRAASARLQDAASTNRVLRDEVLGLGQRSALIEENLARLAEDARQDSHALHVDEAELLLTQAAQRLEGADDLAGARRLYALAATQLEDLPSADGLNLRQALLQERNVLDGAGNGPRAEVRQRLAGFADALQTLPLHTPESPADAARVRPWWEIALAPFVQITPSRLSGPLTDAQRVAGADALQVELTLARAAVERGDSTALQQALDRIEHGMTRLWPDSPDLRRQRAELRALRSAPLRLGAPELGSTLQQLRTLRDGETPL
ncbi:uroporphyrinogen-III C-methyltransferase [Stenotrophomonas chelatiphaga]|uniref:uroporphyrinogen-III C-methyltransferase n=1 Tax=Stenotrophomonas chelatiphaga TaxID=517011 RepID=UPI00289BD57D|nr:uroporphyrinogen-III C-methyltransferase [Stenotrophomonas chelatiphaga]